MPEIARRSECVESLAIRAIADGVHRQGPACPRSGPDHLRELFSGRNRDARAVEQPGRLRAERSVHEGLQVAESQEVVADPGAEPESFEPLDLLVWERLPDAECQPFALVDPSVDSRSSEPAVLVVNCGDASRVGDLEALAGSVQPLVLGHGDVLLTEAPRGLLAQDARR